MKSNDQGDFESLSDPKRNVLAIIAAIICIAYIFGLTLTFINLKRLLERKHTAIAVRSQISIIIIELFRLLTAILCISQAFPGDPKNIGLVYCIFTNTSQFMSLLFAL